GDVLAHLHGMRLRLVGLRAQPGDDRDAVVTEDHEAVVQVAHQPGELELEDAVQGLDDLGGFSLVEFGCHEFSPCGPRPGIHGKPAGGVSYMRHGRVTEVSMSGFYDIAVARLDGTPDLLGGLRGKVVLAVNVASRCGLTPQYEGLEQLQRD